MATLKTNSREYARKCERCGTTKNLIVHHISYNPEITQILCRKCHSKIHRGKYDLSDVMPKRCPLACWTKNYDRNKILDLEKGLCFFPPIAVDDGIDGITKFCNCPEVLTTAPPYTECQVFSLWFWHEIIKNSIVKIPSLKRRSENGDFSSGDQN